MIPPSMVAHTVLLEQIAASPPDTAPLLEVGPALPPEAVAAYITDVPVLTSIGVVQPVFPGYGMGMDDQKFAQLTVMTSILGQAPALQPDPGIKENKPTFPSMVAHAVPIEENFHLPPAGAGGANEDDIVPVLTSIEVFAQQAVPVLPSQAVHRLWKLAVMEAILKQLPAAEAEKDEPTPMFPSMVAHKVPLEPLVPSTVATEPPEEVLSILPAGDDDDDEEGPALAAVDALACEAPPMLSVAIARKLAQIAVMEAILGQISAADAEKEQSFPILPSMIAHRVPLEQLVPTQASVEPLEEVLPMVPAYIDVDEEGTPVVMAVDVLTSDAGPVLPSATARKLEELAAMEAVLEQGPTVGTEELQPTSMLPSMISHRVPVEPLVLVTLEQVSPIVVAHDDYLDYDDFTPMEIETPPVLPRSYSGGFAQLAIIEVIADEALEEQRMDPMVQ